MIMPYGRKPTQAEPGKGPGEVDFNALWDKAYVPVIKKLGYDPVRADQDVGALIINLMLERLYFADIVLADVTIPNGNVYYEIGIRHAARSTGCVLLAADWSRGLFDIAQLKTVRYPMPEGAITDTTAKSIQRSIKDEIARLIPASSPMVEAIKGYPDHFNPAAGTTMQEFMRDLAQLQGNIRAIRALPKPDRMAEAQELVKVHGTVPIAPPVAIALVRALREAVNESRDWAQVIAFVQTLPPALANQSVFREHLAFALSGVEQYLQSIKVLEALIAEFGATPERKGLVGGRFKRLMIAAEAKGDPQEVARLRDETIKAYQEGMDLDLNEFFCSSNLPRLYRARGRPGDEKLAQTALAQVMLACERALARGSVDEYLPQTFLTSAFDAGDTIRAEQFAAKVDTLGPPTYKIEPFLDDLSNSARLVADADARVRLETIVAQLRGRLAARP